MKEPLFETIRPRTTRIGRRIIHHATLGSTMDEARRLALGNADEGAVVVADEQTQGRGRLNRTWFSPKGALLATLVARPRLPPDRASLIPTAAGVSLAQSIQKLVKAPARLKWPNDVWLEGKKVAGILVESRLQQDRPEFTLVGIGVNGDLRPEDFPEPIRATATSVSAWAGRHVCLPALLKIFLEEFEAALFALEAGQTAGLVEAANRLSVIAGQGVRVTTGAGDVIGTAERIGERGELVVRTLQGARAVDVGDCELLRVETR